MQPILLSFRGKSPLIHPSAFIAPGAVVIGDVEIGPDSSVWFGCVVRGDMGPIRIGARTNIQDGSVVHVTEGGHGCFIGDDVTVGHMALIHDCRIDAFSFIGMRSTIMDGAHVQSHAMLAAAAVLTEGKVLPSGQMWMGAPAKFHRAIRPEEKEIFESRAAEYVAKAKDYR